MQTIALIGGGHIHTPGFIKTLKSRSDIKVKTVWDHDAARAAKRAEELGAAVDPDVKNIWADAEVAAAVVCSETNLHEDLVVPAALAKKHLFVEKPLGIGSRDAYRMSDAIERGGVIFQTGYFSRGWPPVLFLREHVQKGTFGKVTRVRGSNCHSGALGGWFDGEWRWMADVKKAGCGAFGDLGTHSLDILIWLFGEVDLVTAALDNGTARYPGCDETGEAILRFKSGTIGTLAAAWDDVANPVQYLVSGTEAHAAVIDGKVYLKAEKSGFDGKSPIPDDQLPKGWPHAFDLFLDAITGKADVPLVGAREAAYRSAVMEAMYASAKSRKWASP